ncbi:glycosyltransferase family 4 protein [Xanthomonas floridensis]|uniref:Glycosyltransferase family 1 protein n=1 Tax=Xanthomonas floridensis TaxID=1843580 RepID=A0A1A9M816_9XANT|nr:glycosyltransferase family 1 protein [Xanthomonas floridensis]MEA5125715.1 glycosyltransferase family 1 protein [Xanthomonas floridensis]MEA5133590.1 glycosyltransferase family 1 protein [Xanthomonas floridensis]OAG66673.1 mannosyltransferase [Xanthomonas floridensis]
MRIILATESIRHPLTGVGRYTQELAVHLERLPQIESLQYLHGRRLMQQRPDPGSASTVTPWLRDRFSRIEVATDVYRRLNNLAKARALRGQDALFHGCNYYVPAYAGPSIATFHDISIYRWPECHRADRVRYMRKELALAVRRAQLIVTVSEFSRQEIAAHFGLPLARVRAIPLAADAAFRPHAPAELAAPLQALGLETDAYCLCVSTIEPRKNIDILLTAYAALPAALRVRYPLVIAGHSGWSSDSLHARMQRAEQAGWLRYLGYVPQDSLPALVAGARLFVFPSLYEGFGLPVLEAMASGTPVLCSSASALPEVAADAAALFDPADSTALAQVLARGIDDAVWREAASRAGLQRAAQFSWQRCAAATADVYRHVLAA